MTGNEILVNMMNVGYFRNSELVNCFYEFSKRLQLPQNKELKEKINWAQHPYFSKVYRRLILKMPVLNVNN